MSNDYVFFTKNTIIVLINYLPYSSIIQIWCHFYNLCTKTENVVITDNNSYNLRKGHD